MTSKADRIAGSEKHWVSLCLATALLIGVSTQAQAKDEHPNRYIQVNLVSDISGVAALTDPDLVNPWGISFGPTTPFWVSDNGAGVSTLYTVTNDSSGMTHVVKRSLVVSIPGEGNVTGQVFEGTGSFNSDIFLFVSEDGTISGWRGALGTAAEVLVPASGAIYKGVTVVTTGTDKWLLAANFSAGSIDVFDTSMALVGQFSDPDAPADYAPFNVQAIGGKVYVTYAKQDDQKEDEIAGPGFGLVDSFDPATGTFERIATGTDAGGDIRTINAPWGVAVAPDTFGKHAGALLVGNFGSGTIMAFDPEDGEYEGLLRAWNNRPVMIDGLWGLAFGNGGNGGDPNKLYFTAGLDGESHGLFGSLEPTRKPNSKSKSGEHDE